MGQHVWLLLATIITELLVITKWSKGQFPAPLPTRVRWAWTVGAALLVLYPTFRVRTISPTLHFMHCLMAIPVMMTMMITVLIVDDAQFGLPKARRYLRRQSRKMKAQ